MSESIVATRLARNLRYKLTYVRVFETFLESATGLELPEHLQLLIQTQQAAISALAGYLRRLGVNTQDLELNDKLLEQAAGRTDARSQLRFIYEGLERAVGWYRMQLVDRQMTGDLDLRGLLLELGEMEAAKLWRTEAVMAILRIPTKHKESVPEEEPVIEPERQESWRPRLIDDFGRPSWAAEQKPRWAPRPKPRRKEKCPRSTTSPKKGEPQCRSRRLGWLAVD